MMNIVADKSTDNAEPLSKFDHCDDEYHCP